MKFNFKLNPKLLIQILIIAIIFIIGGVGGYFYSQKCKQSDNHTQELSQENKYLAFFNESYSVIKDNFWNKLEEDQFNKIYILGTEKLTGTPTQDNPKTKEELLEFLEKTLKNYDDDTKKKDFTVALTDIVLQNLEPFGRSRLYTQKDEKALADNVQNKNLEIDRYETLGIAKDASPEAIKIAYEEKEKKWNPETNKDPEAPKKYEEVQQAYKVLEDEQNKKLYDTAKIEPTLDHKMIGDKIFYLKLSKFSPTTVQELDRTASKAKPTADTLIFDLSGNIGGFIDGLPYFLGPFIGPDQYAYQFFHQAEKQDFKTKAGWLDSFIPFKKVIILIDEQSQSTAEVMAATLKKYNVGVLVGTPTRGWGTVERVFKLESQITEGETYSIFLVHSLTLREDGKPIEGNKVIPTIDITSDNWENELLKYFNSQDIVNAVKQIKEK